jgi:hypothetical protein
LWFVVHVQLNDFMSSLRVPAGLKVTLREHPNYNGRGLEITGPADIACLDNWQFAKVTSSMRIAGKSGCVVRLPALLMTLVLLL